MMVAFDPTPPPGLDQETLAAVRNALVRYLRDGVPSRELHDALTAMARESRDRRIPAERMLVILKGLWGELREVRQTERTPERDRLLERLITICIQQYYLIG